MPYWGLIRLTMDERYMSKQKLGNIVISFPRSGTDFLSRALVMDSRVRYFREYFNPLCNKDREQALSVCFGDERPTHFLKIMSESPAHVIDQVLSMTWQKDRFNFTKENFSALKLEHLQTRFTTVILIRRLCHTFPTRHPEFIVPILSSFLMAPRYREVPLSAELNELRDFLTRDVAITDVQQACALAYLVHHYILLDAAQRHDIPILEYEDLVTASENRLREAILPLNVFGLDLQKVADGLIADRNLFGGISEFRPALAPPKPFSKRWIKQKLKGTPLPRPTKDFTSILSERRNRFEGLGIGDTVSKAVALMHQMSPQLASMFDRYFCRSV